MLLVSVFKNKIMCESRVCVLCAYMMREEGGEGRVMRGGEGEKEEGEDGFWPFSPHFRSRKENHDLARKKLFFSHEVWVFRYNFVLFLLVLPLRKKLEISSLVFVIFVLFFHRRIHP